MHIMILVPNYIPNQGGVEIATNLIAKELSSRKHTIIVVTSLEDGSPEYEIIGNIKIFRFPTNKHLTTPWGGYHFIKKHLDDILKIAKREKIDVINIIQHSRVCSWTYLLKSKTNIPIVTTVHTLLCADDRSLSWHFSFVEPFRRLFYLYPSLWFEKRSLCSSDYVLSISKELLDHCNKIRRDNNVELIPNAINFEQFNPNIKPKDIGYSDTYKVLCSGRFAPEKGQIYLIKAIAKASKRIPVCLFLLGGGSTACKQRLELEVRKLGIEDIVHFMDSLPYDEVPALYKSMDLIVQPSLSETFGIAILENMALGNIVIASAVGGIPEVIDDGVNGLLVPPADPDILADKIVEALTVAELRVMIKRNAQIKASKFNISTVTDRYESLLSIFAKNLENTSGKVVKNVEMNEHP